jgi:hypothetical protein
VARALLDSRGLVMTDRLIDAARQAARTGLLPRGEATRVVTALTASQTAESYDSPVRPPKTMVFIPADATGRTAGRSGRDQTSVTDR